MDCCPACAIAYERSICSRCGAPASIPVRFSLVRRLSVGERGVIDLAMTEHLGQLSGLSLEVGFPGGDGEALACRTVAAEAGGYPAGWFSVVANRPGDLVLDLAVNGFDHHGRRRQYRAELCLLGAVTSVGTGIVVETSGQDTINDQIDIRAPAGTPIQVRRDRRDQVGGKINVELVSPDDASASGLAGQAILAHTALELPSEIEHDIRGYLDDGLPERSLPLFGGCPREELAPPLQLLFDRVCERLREPARLALEEARTAGAARMEGVLGRFGPVLPSDEVGRERSRLRRFHRELSVALEALDRGHVDMACEAAEAARAILPRDPRLDELEDELVEARILDASASSTRSAAINASARAIARTGRMGTRVQATLAAFPGPARCFLRESGTAFWYLLVGTPEAWIGRLDRQAQADCLLTERRGAQDSPISRRAHRLVSRAGAWWLEATRPRAITDSGDRGVTPHPVVFLAGVRPEEAQDFFAKEAPVRMRPGLRLAYPASRGQVEVAIEGADDAGEDSTGAEEPVPSLVLRITALPPDPERPLEVQRRTVLLGSSPLVWGLDMEGRFAIAPDVAERRGTIRMVDGWPILADAKGQILGILEGHDLRIPPPGSASHTTQYNELILEARNEPK